MHLLIRISDVRNQFRNIILSIPTSFLTDPAFSKNLKKRLCIYMRQRSVRAFYNMVCGCHTVSYLCLYFCEQSTENCQQSILFILKQTFLCKTNLIIKSFMLYSVMYVFTFLTLKDQITHKKRFILLFLWLVRSINHKLRLKTVFSWSFLANAAEWATISQLTWTGFGYISVSLDHQRNVFLAGLILCYYR